MIAEANCHNKSNAGNKFYNGKQLTIKQRTTYQTHIEKNKQMVIMSKTSQLTKTWWDTINVTKVHASIIWSLGRLEHIMIS